MSREYTHKTYAQYSYRASGMLHSTELWQTHGVSKFKGTQNEYNICNEATRTTKNLTGHTCCVNENWRRTQIQGNHGLSNTDNQGTQPYPFLLGSLPCIYRLFMLKTLTWDEKER